MSLIDDALKRAREQGRGVTPAESGNSQAETGAPRPGSPDPWAYAPLPDDRTGRRVLVVSAVAVLVAAAGIAAYFALRRGDRAESSRGERAASDVSSVSPLASARTPPASTSLATVFVAPPPGRPRNSGAGSAAVGAPREAQDRVPGAPGSSAMSAPAAVSSPAISARAPAPTHAPAATTAARMPSSASQSNAAPARPPAESGPLASGSPRMGSAPVWRTEAIVSAPSAPAPLPSSAEMSVPPPSNPPPAPPRSHGAAASAAPPARPHVGTYVAPNGGKIELGGIVYSETSPVALINGRVVPQGAIVEGLTVVSIEENRVELRGDGVHVFLSLK